MTHPFDHRCGTGAGYKAHRRRGEAPCRACVEGHSAERNDLNAGTRKPIDHGTMSGYRKCRKRPEGACGLCREANALDSLRRRAVAPLLGALADPRAEWMAAAPCLGVDPDVFFPTRGQSVDQAKAICATCPAIVQCLDYALANNERHGVWGGRSERERRRIRRQRAARQQLTTTTETLT